MNKNDNKKVALITGVTGQDGSYLTEFLLEKGYSVHGLIRRASTFNTSRIDHLGWARSSGRLKLHYGDLTDSSSIIHIVSKVQPDEIYNLAAQSHVKVSFELSEYTGEVDGLGTLRLLEAIRTCKLENKVRFYQASSSELYGKVHEVPQKETTPFHPRSPYAVAKLYAYWIVQNFRESYNLYACNGILFNHESPRRGENFVTKKITRGVAEIANGLSECLELGNLNAERDWGFAGDYVKAMWLMLQQKNPQDYVIATGKKYSVRDFCEKAFNYVGIRIEWKGTGLDEVGIDSKTKTVRIRVNPTYFRPAEVDELLGDPTKAKTELNWSPNVEIDDLVILMMESDLVCVRGRVAMQKTNEDDQKKQ